MAMPKRLFLFDLFINGESYLGKVTELTLPKLTLKLEDYQGAGMLGSVKVKMGFDSSALEMDITLGGLEATLIKEFGGLNDGTQFRFAGSYRDERTGQSIPCEIQTRGFISELDFGAVKAGEGSSFKLPIKNAYYKLTVDNEVLIEIDHHAMKWIVGGKDLLEQDRKNMGH